MNKMSEIRKNAIWIAVAILLVVLELVGAFDWLYDAILGEDPHIRDAREQQMIEQAYQDGYDDGYSDGLFVAEAEYDANKKGSIAGANVIWKETTNSSCFSYVGFDNLNQKLVVVFRDSGAGYIYSDFSEHDYYLFSNSSSLGSYYNTHIKGSYPSEKVEDIDYFMRRGTFE